MAIAKAAPGATIDRADTLAQAEQLIADGGDYDFVLTDLLLPDSNGFISLLTFRQLLPKARIAVTTSAATFAVIARARALGAVGFVPKTAPIEALSATIGDLLDGGTHFPVDGRTDATDDPASKLLALTPSQLRMVIAAARGDLNKQIAFSTGLTEATVKAHLAAAFKRLGVTNRVQAGLLVQSLAIDQPKVCD